ncbi:MAG: 3-oxoacyl-[acyl-carrier-protein] synthase 3 [Chroococcopsis gigantea SAG 12.99]|nr:ketoacyl-ACP synthase III [Chlorogloea purpurea SAG 13.99]MDV3002311.1 3-oxoacyl-[acyl-carrier-protein] synthase 3 [Chroococcopsis gigantea SAG 12.99]
MKGSGTGTAITGIGSAVPEQLLSNDDLSTIVDTSDEWIKTRTGISQRHLAPPSLLLSQLGANAALRALDMAGITASDVDLILLATSTADDMFGSACQIQALLGADHAVAFDLTAACSGFVVGLVTAAQFIRTGVYRNVLVIGADILSRWVDWNDRSTCVLFGDGAGAIVCQANGENDRLLGFEMHSDGSLAQALSISYNGQSQTLQEEVAIAQGNYESIKMNGKEVYRFAVAKVPEVIEKALYRADLTVQDVDWLLLHQANQRIMDTVAERLAIDNAKVLTNLSKYGNTSAASIPLCLDEAVRSGRVRPGQIIAASGFGAGLTWGAAIFKWGK